MALSREPKSFAYASIITFMIGSGTIAACKPDMVGIGAGGSGGGDNGSAVTSIDMTLPNRDALKTAVPDIETKMNAYHLVVNPVNPAGCQSPTKIDEVAAYGNKPSLAASLKQGCDYDVTLELGNQAGTTPPGQPGQTGAKVYYKDKIKNFFDAKCMNCHATQAPNLGTYANVKAQAAASLAAINAGRMPKGGVVGQTDKDALKAWIDGGMLEAETPAAGTGTPKVTYDNRIKSILDAKCVTCHGATPPSLSSFAGAKAAGAAALAAVQAGRMPKGGTMNPADKDALKAWVDGGMLEKDGLSLQNGKALTSVYYKNNTALRVKKEDINGKPTLAVSLSLQLQEAGRAIGLGGGATPPGTTAPGVTTPGTTPASGTGADFRVQAVTGPAVKVADLIKGRYALVEFAASTCAGCIQQATALNADTAMQALLSGSKCTTVVIVGQTDLTAWHNAAGGSGAFVGKQSYSQVDTTEFAQLVTGLGGTFAGTPAYVFLDQSGKRVIDTNSIPTAEIQKHCAP
jgi:hypothetical protein